MYRSRPVAAASTRSTGQRHPELSSAMFDDQAFLFTAAADGDHVEPLDEYLASPQPVTEPPIPSAARSTHQSAR